MKLPFFPRHRTHVPMDMAAQDRLAEEMRHDMRSHAATEARADHREDASDQARAWVAGGAVVSLLYERMAAKMRATETPAERSQEPTAGRGSDASAAPFAASTSGLDHGERYAGDAGEGRQPQQRKDKDMARAAKKEPVVEQVHAPDFDLAVSIYRKDIKPAASKVGEHAQEMSEAYKAIKKRANIQPQAARLAFRLDDMEESKRDDFLRSFNGLLKKLNIFMPIDLVDAAEGKGDTGEGVVPTGSRRRPQLVTVDHPADDSDLADAAE